MLGSTAVRSAKATADTVTAETALTFPRLRIGPREVEGDLVSIDRDGHDDARRSLLVGSGARGVDHVLASPATVGQRGQDRPHAALAVGHDLRERSVTQRDQALEADHVGADLGVKVAGPLVWRARRREQQVSQLVGVARRWDAEALLLDLGGVGGDRAGGGAADVGMVRAVRHPADLPTITVEHRRDHRDVVEVGAPGERVVDHDMVTGLEPTAVGVDGRPHRGGHRAQVHGDVLGLRQQVTGCVEHRR